MTISHPLLHAGLVLADGAMGTYFSQLTGLAASACELANLDQPDIVRQIHSSYLQAGARLLRTNTFAAASQYIPGQQSLLEEIVRGGWQLASQSARSFHTSSEPVFIAADIGPAYSLDTEDATMAMQIIIDTFLDCGADLFLFETFADPDELLPWCRYIKEKSPDMLVMVSFALSPDGLTRKGHRLADISQIMEQSPAVDIWGLNCGIGPTHIHQQLETLPAEGKPLTLMPNSGYPRLENERLVYGTNPEYFAEALYGLLNSRTQIIGGCCGTTPNHIAAVTRQLAAHISGPNALANAPAEQVSPVKTARKDESSTTDSEQQSVSVFTDKYRLADRQRDQHKHKRFVLVCELDPPRDSQMDQLLASARLLKQQGLDALTIADSPLARVKLDPVVCAARLSREINISVMPHLCCRDRNANALRSLLLAAHSEGLRQVLAITGDAIPEQARGFVKPVFNVNSTGLLEIINQLNQDLFKADPLLAAAALDPGAPNQAAEFRRAQKKISQGATLFLTQPLYEPAGLDLIRRVRQAGADVYIGLMPLVSLRNARFLSEEVPGIRIPASIITQFSAEQPQEAARQTGIRLIVELARKLYQEADGFYLIAPFNRADIIAQICAQLQNLGIHQPQEAVLQ